MTFWSYFWRMCIAMPIGSFWCAYGVIAPLICIRFGIPATNYLQGKTMIDCDSIRKKYWFSILFWLVVDAIGVLLAVLFISDIWAFGIAGGAFLSFVFGVGKTGINTSNIKDYIETNKRWIDDLCYDEVAKLLVEVLLIKTAK